MVAQFRLRRGVRMQAVGLECAVVHRDRFQQERQECGLVLLGEFAERAFEAWV